MSEGKSAFNAATACVHAQESFGSAGFDLQKYAGHSYIGAAITAAACGVPVDIIKTLGKWKSEAYQLYIRLHRSQLAEISSLLSSAEI